MLTGGKVSFRQATISRGTSILPSAAIDPIDTIVRLELDGSAMDIPPVSLPPEIKATASNVFQNMTSDYGPQQAFDGDPQPAGPPTPAPSKLGSPST